MKDFKKYYIIDGTPEEVYKALTDPFTIQLWTNESAEMSTEPGSEFSMWDGSIAGKNIDFVANHKIEQEWYFGEQEEKSIVLIKLHPHKKGTSVELRHSNIPEEDYDDFVDGWDHSYFSSLQEFFTL